VRSRPERRTALAPAALALTALLASAAPRAAAPPVGQVPSDEQIAAAVQALRADPNLGAKRTERTLRWVNEKQPKPTSGNGAAWLRWISDFFGWFARTSEFLFWGAIVLLAAFLGIFVVRLLRAPAASRSKDRFTPPSHVRDLDIRPESLPADVGAAARALWERKEQRAALALLYRGLISRLVHVHGIPIRGSSTEGECLALAAPRLEQSPQRYASRLVRTWQQSVYGGREPTTESVFALCDEFAGALAARTPAAASAA
jgi:hypothetical protein